VRYVAWLNAVPHVEPDGKSKGVNKTRLEQLREIQKNDRYNPELPPVRAAYMLGYLYEIGPTNAGNAITHSEIESWQNNIRIRLTPWECRTIRSLSIEYLNELHKAGSAGSKSPWQSEESNIDKYLAAKRAQDAWREVAKK
jgi:hypothetical protein